MVAGSGPSFFDGLVGYSQGNVGDPIPQRSCEAAPTFSSRSHFVATSLPYTPLLMQRIRAASPLPIPFAFYSDTSDTISSNAMTISPSNYFCDDGDTSQITEWTINVHDLLE